MREASEPRMPRELDFLQVGSKKPAGSPLNGSGQSDDLADHGNWLVDVLETYQGPLVRYAFRILGDLDAARDMVQDCFLSLCRQRQADVEDHVAEWLFAVCRNRALDLRRKKPMATFDTTDLASRVPGPTADLESSEERTRMNGRIGALPERDQELLRLKFQEGLSYKQISAVTDLSVSNVGFILHKALRRLRSELTTENATRRQA